MGLGRESGSRGWGGLGCGGQVEGECNQTVEKRQHKSYIIKIMTGLGLAEVCQVERAEWLGEAKPRQADNNKNK